MDTIRVDICYRPLRIGWGIRSGDLDAFRTAVRTTYALWGGQFNPILVLDRDVEARQLVNFFRVDLVWPLPERTDGSSREEEFPHLIPPFLQDSLFVGSPTERKRSQVLDIHNALVHMATTPEWKTIIDRGMRLYTWGTADPLADVLMMHLGAYPTAAETGLDYRSLVAHVGLATEHPLHADAPISEDSLKHPTIPHLSRLAISRHYSIQAHYDTPGLFLGSANSFDDLVAYWNLRATDISVLFVDTDHLSRYSLILPLWLNILRDRVARRRHEWDRELAVWSRSAPADQSVTDFVRGLGLERYQTPSLQWDGSSLGASLMYLGQASSLGVLGTESGRPKVTFALTDKPFSGDVTFYGQHLVASVALAGGLSGDDHHTLEPPYLPELNEFYARTMHFLYNKLRVEPERIGIVISSADHDSFLYALPVPELVERVFGIAGFKVELSASGLIARQLAARLGGLQGARVFKIPGVRRLLRTYGPTDRFTKRAALQLIGGPDPENPRATFSDYVSLFIEPRPDGRLTAPSVFGYLVEKGVFRIGAELTCPSCRLTSWTALDSLKHRVVCDFCGHEYDATRQLVDSEWHYRRSGLLGLERNAQGAIPVLLTLQQLEANSHGGPFERTYSMALNVKSLRENDPFKCEIDFVWIDSRREGRTVLVLGECKDQGLVKPVEFRQDVDNLRRVADSFPSDRFDVFVLFAKLSAFTSEEIEMARSLNVEYSNRVILLTARELEPYFMYERTKREFKVELRSGAATDLAHATHRIYFASRQR